MKPLLRARCRVDKVGENSATWAKATSSAGVAEPIVASAEWLTGVDGDGLEEEIATIGCRGFGGR
jgi:hypothetical protein